MVAQVFLIENPLDDIASPLGISSNMLIKAAITEISFFSIFCTIKHASNERKVSIPMFSWSKDQIRPCLKIVSGSYGIQYIHVGSTSSTRFPSSVLYTSLFR